MINKDQVWTFTALFAPKLPFLCVFGEMAQVWRWVTHTDEECQTYTKVASSVISWPAMLSCRPVWWETSRLTNSITVCATSRTSVTVCYVWRLRPFWDKISGIWTEDAVNGPICLIRAKNDQLWGNLPHYSPFCLRLLWYVRIRYRWHEMLK
jgi:hypothetical protein